MFGYELLKVTPELCKVRPVEQYMLARSQVAPVIGPRD